MSSFAAVILGLLAVGLYFMILRTLHKKKNQEKKESKRIVPNRERGKSYLFTKVISGDTTLSVRSLYGNVQEQYFKNHEKDRQLKITNEVLFQRLLKPETRIGDTDSKKIRVDTLEEQPEPADPEITDAFMDSMVFEYYENEGDNQGVEKKEERTEISDATDEVAVNEKTDKEQNLDGKQQLRMERLKYLQSKK